MHGGVLGLIWGLCKIIVFMGFIGLSEKRAHEASKPCSNQPRVFELREGSEQRQGLAEPFPVDAFVFARKRPRSPVTLGNAAGLEGSSVVDLECSRQTCKQTNIPTHMHTHVSMYIYIYTCIRFTHIYTGTTCGLPCGGLCVSKVPRPSTPCQAFGH